jgi:hypothetical protein
LVRRFVHLPPSLIVDLGDDRSISPGSRQSANPLWGSVALPKGVVQPAVLEADLEVPLDRQRLKHPLGLTGTVSEI